MGARASGAILTSMPCWFSTDWPSPGSSPPAGPLSCFGAAIYEVDWSGVTDSPLEVTLPFELSSNAPADASAGGQR